MDPIFVVLDQIPQVLVVAGYVDDTTIVGRQTDPNWVREVFQNIRKWKSAGIGNSSFLLKTYSAS